MTTFSPITPGIAIITGASSGIGRSAAIALNKAGWTVVLVARRKEAMDEAIVAMGEEGGKRARAIVADLSKEEEVLMVFRVVRQEYGMFPFVQR